MQPYLPSSISDENYGNYEDPQEVELYDKMLHETDPAKQHAEMRAVREVRPRRPGARDLMLLWWNRIVPYRSYVKGWKISPSHYINQDLATIWLDK